MNDTPVRLSGARLRTVLDAVRPFGSREPAIADLLDRMGRAEGPVTLSFVNANTLWHACADPAFADDLLSSDLLLRDGVGARLLMRLLSRESGANLNGTDLLPALLRALGEPPTALLGTAEPWLSRAAARLEGTGAAVVLTGDGFRNAADYVGAVQGSEADLVILGMGHPKQEAVASLLRGAVRRPVLIVSAGAFIDFTAGRFPRAPALVRRWGLEWLFRLCLEPQRLFSRYLVRTPGLLLLALLTWPLDRRPPAAGEVTAAAHKGAR